jgi:hypothetical protein
MIRHAMRYLVPVILFAAAGFVWHYNATHDDSYLLFPFLDLVPALADDLDAQAEWSWRVMAGIGVLSLLLTIGGDLRRRSKRPKSEQE